MLNTDIKSNKENKPVTPLRSPSRDRVNNSRFSSMGSSGGVFGSIQTECVSRLFDKWLLRAHPPARLKAAEAADLLGFHEDDMAVLVREGFISPLGNPKHNAVKYFALCDVEELKRDPQSISAATEVIYERNRLKAPVDSCDGSDSSFVVVECVANPF